MLHSNLISNKLIISQLVILNLNGRLYKFGISTNVKDDKLTYNNVSVECDYNESIEDLQWTGTYTFWEILDDINLKIKDFARDINIKNSIKSKNFEEGLKDFDEKN